MASISSTDSSSSSSSSSTVSSSGSTVSATTTHLLPQDHPIMIVSQRSKSSLQAIQAETEQLKQQQKLITTQIEQLMGALNVTEQLHRLAISGVEQKISLLHFAQNLEHNLGSFRTKFSVLLEEQRKMQQAIQLKESEIETLKGVQFALEELQKSSVFDTITGLMQPTPT